MDFSKLNGYEFEDVVGSLFRAMGFNVESTSYSQDGGVDLVILDKHPITGGHYIIQCKNWAQNVGAPAVRDLFGIVAGEHANRGILISTSDFTPKAYEFAQGKNINLINGEKLIAIIQEFAPQLLSGKQFKTTTFESCSSFNRERYQYLKDLINKAPTDNAHYDAMISFLLSYVESDNPHIVEIVGNNGIFDAIEHYITLSSQKCFSGNKKRLHQQGCDLQKIQLYMLSGKLEEAIRLAIEYELFFYPKFPTLPPYGVVAYLNGSAIGYYNQDTVAMCLYAFLKQLHCDDGCKQCLRQVHFVDLNDESDYEQIKGNRLFGTDWLFPSRLAWQRAFAAGELDDLFPFFIPEVNYKKNASFRDHLIIAKGVAERESPSITYRKASFFIKAFYKRPHEEIIRGIEQVFRQCGIL